MLFWLARSKVMLKNYSGWVVALMLLLVCAVQFYYRVDNAVTEAHGNEELRYQAQTILEQQELIYDLSQKYREEELLRILEKRCQIVKKDVAGNVFAGSMKITFEKGKITKLTDINQRFLEDLAKQ